MNKRRSSAAFAPARFGMAKRTVRHHWWLAAWGVFRARFRWPTCEEAAEDRFTTIRRGSVKTLSRCRRDAVAAAISLRIRRFAGRLAKPLAGEKPPALVILQIEYKASSDRARPFCE
ncbi:MAG: hypothetical protein H0Z34_06215 [Brevibacillus sp.]|nr:hypothetical protein [Brevibacillus sp.]